MKRCKWGQCVESLDDRGSEPDRINEVAAAMHNAMAGGDKPPAAELLLDPAQHLAESRAV
jgi:hypothetical protein